MNPLLLSFIKENLGLVPVFIIALFVGAMWFTKWRTKVNARLEDLEPPRKGR